MVIHYHFNSCQGHNIYKLPRFSTFKKILMPLGNQLSFNSGEVDNICKQLQDCQEGINTVLHMENQLYDDKVISLLESTEKCTEHNVENKSMIQLEVTLLDMASTADLCKGVLYIFPVKLMDKYIVRYLFS